MSKVIYTDEHRSQVVIHNNVTGDIHVLPLTLVKDLASGKVVDNLTNDELIMFVQLFASAFINDHNLNSNGE